MDIGVDTDIELEMVMVIHYMIKTIDYICVFIHIHMIYTNSVMMSTRDIPRVHTPCRR